MDRLERVGLAVVLGELGLEEQQRHQRRRRGDPADADFDRLGRGGLRRAPRRAQRQAGCSGEGRASNPPGGDCYLRQG